MNEELKPCPFCGGADNVELNESHVGFSIECYTCEFHVGGDLTEKAVTDLWNTRASALGTLKLHLSVLDTEPSSELVDIIVKHANDMPEPMHREFIEWIEKHTTDED